MRTNNVQQLIPHRFPVLLVDEVCEYEQHQWIRGIKSISRNDRLSPAFYPLLLCEALAQLSKVLESLSGMPKREISYLAALQVDFYGPVTPGDKVLLFARKEKSFQRMFSYYVEAEVDSEKVLKGYFHRRQNVQAPAPCLPGKANVKG